MKGEARKLLRGTITLILLSAVLLAALSLAGCGGKGGGEASGPGSRIITDLAGREVEVTVPAERVTAIGPGALRLVCYAGGADKVVGIENVEKQWSTGRPYIMAHPELLNLPVIGQGGPDSTPDPEMLLSVDPDVIFVAYLVDAAKADELQSKTGIPVVVLSYGQLGTFDREIYDSISLIGEIIGEEERAEEVIAYIKGCRDDLAGRTADIPAGEKPRVYVGAIGMKGTHGIESTQGNFPPLASIGAVNVVDETGSKGSVMIDKEKLIAWNPDIIFIDESGLQMVRDDYAGNPGFYNSLKAVKEGKVYGYLPYNYYTTNIDTAIADAYFMGKAVFPEAFEDVDPEAKADEIYGFLLGEALYRRMAADFGGFKKIDLGSL
ncbi:MAG: iron ABC transporter substrate-binding protein [Actinobacteria bacterium]|nr:iron ABC transporter substrate-binding protein [Actinomycetota bacterium]